MRMYSRLVIFLVGIAGIIGVFVYFDLGSYFSLEAIQAQRLLLLSKVDAAPLLYGTVFSLLYITAVALSLPIAAVLSLLAGFLFGLFFGTGIVVFSATVGATLIFLFARYFVGAQLLDSYKIKAEKLVHEIEENGFSYLLFLRLVPLFPFFLVNIAPAATSMKTRTFFLATLIGIIPGSFAYVAAGTSLANIESVGDIITPPVFGGFLALGVISLIPVLWKKYKKRSVAI